MALGYNGIGRLLGGNGGGGAGAAGSAFGGATGLTRLFGSEMGLEISWLLPAALIALVAGLWLSNPGMGRRAARTDRLRASMLLWGGWTLGGLVFSFMSGTVHPYYTVALARGIVALVAVGGRGLWVRRESVAARAGLAPMTAATAAWSFVLLAGSAESFAWIRWVIAAVGAVAVAGLLLGAGRPRRAAVLGVTAAVFTGLAGTAAYGVATAAGTHSGSIPSVGTVSSETGGAGPGTPPGGAGSAALFEGAGAGDPAGGGGMGGAVSAELTALLSATDTTWSAAVGTSQSAAAMELASGTAVMSLGGWSGRIRP